MSWVGSLLVWREDEMLIIDLLFNVLAPVIYNEKE